MNAKRIPVLPSVVATIAAVAVAMADPSPPAAPKAGAAKPAAGDPAGDPAAVPLLVSPAWLAAQLKDPNLVLLHVGDEEAYKKKHIAGARRVALSEISISKHGDGLMLELPPAEDLRGRLEAIGISNTRARPRAGEAKASAAVAIAAA